MERWELIFCIVTILLMIIIAWMVFNGLKNCKSCHHEEPKEDHVHIQ